MNIPLNETTYLLIGSDYTFELFQDPQKALGFNSDGFLVSIRHSSDYTATSSGNKTPIYNIRFLDNSLRIRNIKKNNWILYGTSDGKARGGLAMGDDFKLHDPWFSPMNEFRIADPTGKIQAERYTTYPSLDNYAPITCLKYFHHVSKYSNWSEYELKMENDRLMEENEELKRKLENK